MAYLAFSQNIVLDQIMRQSDTDNSTIAFKDCLSRLRAGTVLPCDREILSSRIWDRISVTERLTFDSAVLLASTKQIVRHSNLTTLSNAGQPVLLCSSRNSNPVVAKASPDQAEGLPRLMYMMKGAKVMMTRNLWTEAGLLNGTMGVIAEIGSRPGDLPGKSLPGVVMIACRYYRGPTGWRTSEGVPVIPVVPETATWDSAGGTCSRTQSSLTLAYAITVHKSQGMTLDKARIHLGERDFAAGLTFVALSRVKRLDGLLFTFAFSAERLSKVGGSEPTRQRARVDEQRRLALGYSVEPSL